MRPPRTRQWKPKIARVPEKVEQANGVEFLRRISSQVWVLGTKRPKTDKCHSTRQTPGIPDVYAILPPRHRRGETRRRPLWWEVKARDGKRSGDQDDFREAVLACEDHFYVCGGLQALINFLVAEGYVLETSLPHYKQPSQQPGVTGRSYPDVYNA